MAIRRRENVPAETYDESENEYEVNMSKDVEDEVEDARPARRASGGAAKPISSGWGAPKQERRETVKSERLDLKDKKKHIVKLLEDEPSVRFRQHYVNSAGRYYTCAGRGVCPLCAAGHRASDRYQMNVVDMKDPEKVLTWGFGNEVAQQLQEFASEDVTSPLNKETLYFHVYYITVAGRSAPSTKVMALKARDLEEDYGVVPLNSDELDALSENLYGEETIWIDTIGRLEDAADNLTPNDTKRGN